MKEKTKFVSTSDEILDEKKVFTGLNDCAFAAIFDLFAFTKSASFIILKKMSEYSSFNAFMADAADSPALTFIPELHPEIKDDKEAK